jgi:single-strand DNA-binding protein
MTVFINRVQLLGNLGRNPEFFDIGEGRRVAVLSLVTTERWKDRTSGEKRERTDWHRVSVFAQPLVEAIEKYYKKGARVLVEGSLQRREYEKDGEKRYATDVVVSSFGLCRLVDFATQAAETAEDKALPEGEGAPAELPEAAIA